MSSTIMDSITTGLASSTLSGGHKFKIQQSIPSSCIKKGPHVIVRTADLNEGIEIKRRFGEGSKPLFARDDIAVNQTTVGEKCDKVLGNETYGNSSGAAACKSKTNRSSSTESSSPERYRHRDNKKRISPPPGRRKSSERPIRDDRHYRNSDKHSHNIKYSATTKTDKFKITDKRKSRSLSPLRKRTEKSVPYYRDEARERDRLRRLYGNKERGRSRSHSPTSKKNYSPVSKRVDSRNRRRSSSRDKYGRRSPYRSSRRNHRDHRLRSRTRSPQRRERDGHKHSIRSSRERDKEHKDDTVTVATTAMPPTPQFIPIPVPVAADYPYSFPGWATPQFAFPPSHRPPPPHFTPYSMLPMMPPHQAAYGGMRPPHQAGYGGMPPPIHYGPMQVIGFRSHAPQRFAPTGHSTYNYQPRSKKP